MVYTEELLREHCATSTSYSEIVRKITARTKVSASSATLVRKRLDALGVDVSHFTHRSKDYVEHPKARKIITDILVNDPTRNSREKRHHLDRAMKENGVIYRCTACGITGTYNGMAIRLEIDHIDGNWSNNLLTNLQYLCPNCHSQTSTYGYKGIQ